MTGSREKILSDIRNSILKRQATEKIPLDLDGDIYPHLNCSLEEKFCDELVKVNGSCFFCNDHKELNDKLKELITERKWDIVYCIDQQLRTLLTDIDDLFCHDNDKFRQTEAAVTTCEFLIARTGSVMVSSALSSGRRFNVFPPVHIIVAYSSQLVYDLSDAYNNMRQKYPGALPSMISVITGPSRTADIEKTLILGAHGPKEFIVFVVK